TDRAERLRALVRLRVGELGDERGAFEALGELVLLEPEVPEHRNELARMADRIGDHARFADVLATAASRTSGPRRTELMAQGARVFDGRVGDRERAIELSRSILTAAGDDPGAALAASRELDRLLADAGRHVERREVLARLAGLESEPAGRRAAFAELARI